MPPWFSRVTDGYFAYPDLPKDVSDVQIELNVDYRGTEMDATTVSLDRFHLLVGGNPFDLKLKVQDPISDMHVGSEALGTIDFTSPERGDPAGRCNYGWAPGS